MSPTMSPTMPPVRPAGFAHHPPVALALGCALASLGVQAHAQAPTQVPAQTSAQTSAQTPGPASPAAAAASAPLAARPPAAQPAAVQTVEITAAKGNEGDAERRRATASRIVIGREEIDRMGDGSLADVLKRLPGVSVGGAPGRGGGVRMRGMGGGYTLILIDGQRMPPGFSLDNVPPEQIERIEIMRAPVAEFSGRAIAGTINVVMRSDFKRRDNELRFGAGADGSRPQAGGSWQRNGQTDMLGYNTSVSAFQSGRASDELTTVSGGLDDDGNAVGGQLVRSHSQGTRRGLFTNARLQFKLGSGRTLDLQPFLHVYRNESQGRQEREASSASTLLPFRQANVSDQSENRMARLNGTWLSSLGDGGKLQLRFGTRLAQSSRHSDRLETGGTASSLTPGYRQRTVDSRSREQGLDLNGKFSQLLAERHSISLGGELEQSRRNDTRVELVNKQPQIDQNGDTVKATVQRLALFAQDEWDWNPQLSFYLGARYEAILTTSDTAASRVNNRSGVLTPLAHLVWKLPHSPRDQIRASLTRSYRSPDTGQLVGQLRRATLYPDLSQPNTPTSPDRIGNPDLKPELSWGLEVAFEHYLAAGGLLSANAYVKRIDNLIRNTRSEQIVDYAPVKRWLSRPENIGQADAAGLELEAKGKASDLMDTTLPLSLRANLSLMWSRVSQVSGPNNRLEGQPPYTLNLGGDMPLRGTPLSLGGNLNYTPGFTLQQIDQQSYRQSRKAVVDAYALWRVAPELNLRLSLNNALAEPYSSGTSVYNNDGGLYQSSDTRNRTTTTVNLRAEWRL